MSIQDYNATSPPTRVSTWKMLNEGWGYVTGGLTVADFAADAKLQEDHIKFVESGHDHDGSGSHAIARDSIRKKNFDLQTCSIAWGVYFQDRVSEDDANRHSYMVLGGTGSITVSSGGGTPPVIAGVRSGEQNIDFAGSARLHLGTSQLADRDPNWAMTGFMGAIASPIYAADEMACYMMEVDTTNGRFVAYALSDSAPTTVNYDYIVVIRVAGGTP